MSRKEINQVTVIGRVGQDPELRYFESGKSLASFSMAVNRPSKNKETDWFDIKLWGKQAEIAGEYVRKGSLIGIVGQIDFESWNDKTSGELVVKPVISGSELRLLGSKSDNNSSYANN
ncbi:MAG: single-stranded DNA-binding protein [Candidatus Caenarcaniphilales bacterium]|jgi:single-strand DNA-binding protein|nr:single-stranded DNA-binding protein [Candidatus Caenarcaniphilales bacterium]